MYLMQPEHAAKRLVESRVTKGTGSRYLVSTQLLVRMRKSINVSQTIEPPGGCAGHGVSYLQKKLM